MLLMQKPCVFMGGKTGCFTELLLNDWNHFIICSTFIYPYVIFSSRITTKRLTIGNVQTNVSFCNSFIILFSLHRFHRIECQSATVLLFLGQWCENSQPLLYSVLWERASLFELIILNSMFLESKIFCVYDCFFCFLFAWKYFDRDCDVLCLLIGQSFSYVSLKNIYKSKTFNFN